MHYQFMTLYTIPYQKLPRLCAAACLASIITDYNKTYIPLHQDTQLPSNRGEHHPPDPKPQDVVASGELSEPVILSRRMRSIC